MAWASPDALIQGGALASSNGKTAIQSRRRLCVRITRNAPDATTAGAVMRWVHSARPAAMPQPTSKTTEGRHAPRRVAEVSATAESSRAAGYIGGGMDPISSRYGDGQAARTAAGRAARGSSARPSAQAAGMSARPRTKYTARSVTAEEPSNAKNGAATHASTGEP